MTRFAAIALTVASLLAAPAAAQRMSYGKAPTPGDTGPPNPENVDYVQRLGEYVPLELVFHDHLGQPVALRDLAGGKPTVLVMAYYRCPRLCNEVLVGLLDALKSVHKSDPNFVAGGPFNLVVVSIDPKEDPTTLARPRRQAFLDEYDRRQEDQPGVWFLSASHGQGTDLAEADRQIHRLADAVGFKYTLRQRGREYLYDAADGHWATADGRVMGERAKEYDYQHAPGVVFLAPDGKITRYLLGITFEPTTVRRAVVEASGGQVGSLADKVAFLCFAYDETSGHYRIAMRVLGLVAVPFVLLVGYIAYRAVRSARQEPSLAPGEAPPPAPSAG
ncbi:MAG TPA: SCO family protein [Fimbriiglobus sp.]|jgi:protein SCO1/2|nr:SCO family protein [Fimbriiglobus sp.]